MVVGGVIHIVNNVLRYEPDDVIDIIANDPDLSTLTSLVIAYNLVDTLKGAANFTVFAPSDAAFAAISTVLPNLIDSQVSATLQYHVLPIEALSSDITTNLSVSSVNGLPLIVGPQDSTVFIQAIGMYIFISEISLFDYSNLFFNIASRALVIGVDLTSGNGVVHKTDTVLLPFGSLTDVIDDEPDLSILSAALDETVYGRALDVISDQYTVFAPTDDAFAALLKLLNVTAAQLLANTALLNLVLPYHVILNEAFSFNLTYGQELDTFSGDKLIVNIDKSTANTISLIDEQGTFVEVIETDISSLNGVIHKLSQVLIPKTVIPNTGSIVNALYNENILSTLKDAVVIAKLLKTLGTTSYLTVLAPTNEAFNKLGSSINDILSNVTLLNEILTYHVIEGNFTSYDLENGQKVTTLLGETLTIIKDNNLLQFVDITGNAATVINENNVQTNGIIHIIDNVLNFKYPNIMKLISARDDLKTLTSLLESTGLNETLSSGFFVFTIFAPTDNAFNEADNLNAIIARFGGETNLLLYHTLGNKIISSEALTDGLILNTELSPIITVSNGTSDTGIIDITGSRSNVIVSDILASNGIIHIIDKVLIPGTIADYIVGNSDLSTLESALNAAGYLELLNTTNSLNTILAPNNAAFNEMNPGSYAFKKSITITI